jgi:glycosyltransferase involved in cell wall biosynthesis
MATVHEKYPQVHFVWVGDGELKSEITRLVNSLGLASIFHFAGYRRDVPDLLRAMDIFVLSSHWEGFSLSVLEAMASGLPVVMTRVSGAAEAIIDGETGVVVPIGDTKALAEAIERLVSNPFLARQFGQAGRQRLEQNFTLDRMVKEIENLYEEIIDRTSV